MDAKDMAFEIAQEFIRMESENEALRRILHRSWPPANDPWPQFVQKGTDQILALETTHQRYGQLRSAFDAASDGDSLIRTLHEEILRRAEAA
jgi:hypothetical protein